MTTEKTDYGLILEDKKFEAFLLSIAYQEQVIVPYVKAWQEQVTVSMSLNLAQTNITARMSAYLLEVL